MSRKLFLILFYALWMPSAGFGDSGTEIVRRAQSADKHVDYRGVKTACVYRNGMLTTSIIKIVHQKPDRSRNEYFSPTALAGMIVIQNGPDIWKYIPRERAWEQVFSARGVPAKPGNEGAFTNYQVQLIGTDTVAGRATYVIRAIPRYFGNLLHKVWVDRDCYLMLRTQAETIGGAVVSSSKFTKIDINPHDISQSAFAVPDKAKKEPPKANVDFRLLKPTYLPKGYKLMGLSTACVNGHCCAHLQFSNGVDTISLFERKSYDVSNAPRVPDKLTTVMTWTRNGMLFTLVGEIARSELKKIADSTK